MEKILILGAYGKTAQIVTERLLAETSLKLKLFLRNANRLADLEDNPRIELIEGDATDVLQLEAAMQDVEIVYSNVGEVDLAQTTQAIFTAMETTGVKRLIFYSALGARHEVKGKFGEWNEKAISSYLPGFRKSAALIDKHQGIDTTELRPAWLTDQDEVNYEITKKDENFKGTEVSRKSVAYVVVKIIKDPTRYAHESIGINKPDTAGDRPAWM
ncbi:NAD(P)H-binding protein [Pediococcus acidilactici]|uniref:NAD(P)H-binding protein n=1 Tax=Pediococcus acidilactici TaxID=1254 RepID=UPI00232E9950|nr:NAD(P)H-binding protein [Pediococcus acidilactici]MDB8859789.1 NAD(P)H-binding protein [Pediococcus acidilactici]MDB8861683.1 NAD(P)H-binding protein [Pediococcus acidilactici]MDB8863473.1 NAD(P)H-binding protein [Pediococcus acidilactici]MDB8867179.1 NAD(P)H-binding protein [Pediococcus acidilactici]